MDRHKPMLNGCSVKYKNTISEAIAITGTAISTASLDDLRPKAYSVKEIEEIRFLSHSNLASYVQYVSSMNVKVKVLFVNIFEHIVIRNKGLNSLKTQTTFLGVIIESNYYVIRITLSLYDIYLIHIIKRIHI